MKCQVSISRNFCALSLPFLQNASFWQFALTNFGNTQSLPSATNDDIRLKSAVTEAKATRRNLCKEILLNHPSHSQCKLGKKKKKKRNTRQEPSLTYTNEYINTITLLLSPTPNALILKVLLKINTNICRALYARRRGGKHNRNSNKTLKIL